MIWKQTPLTVTLIYTTKPACVLLHSSSCFEAQGTCAWLLSHHSGFQQQLCVTTCFSFHW